MALLMIHCVAPLWILFKALKAEIQLHKDTASLAPSSDGPIALFTLYTSKRSKQTRTQVTFLFYLKTVFKLWNYSKI